MKFIIDIDNRLIREINGAGVNRQQMAQLLRKEISSAHNFHEEDSWEELFLMCAGSNIIRTSNNGR